MNRIRVLLLFGGESAEHDVSIASARNVFAALDSAKYVAALCYISRDGQWRLVASLDELGDSGDLLMPVLGAGHFIAHPSGKKITPHVLLPILHGTNGEDGSVQGLAQLLHIPIVGCGITGSAVCMDKDIAKRLLVQAEVLVADYVVHRAHEPAPDFTELTAKLGGTLFVKPASQGSSVGVHKVTGTQEFTAALADAHTYGPKVLIEKMVAGREIECAVLGNDRPEASPVGEIKPGESFYSYDDKYAPGSHAQVIVPAGLPAALASRVRETAITVYKTLECRGLARVDFFVTSGGEVYVNEVNTLPGFTNISMYPKLWAAGGVQYPQLVDRLITLALERHAD